MGTGHDALDHVVGGVNAAGTGEIGAEFAGENRQPTQTQQQLLAGGEFKGGDGLKFFDINIRLVKAVEEHQSIDAQIIQLMGKIGQRAVVGGELDGDGNADGLGHSANHFEGAFFELIAGFLRIGGKGVDVQFEGIGTGLLDELGVIGPAADGGAVERADDGNLDRLLDFADLFEVFLRPEAIFIGFGEVGKRLGVAVGVHFHVVDARQPLAGDLFFKE